MPSRRALLEQCCGLVVLATAGCAASRTDEPSATASTSAVSAETAEATATATTATGTTTYDFPYRFRLYNGDDAAHSIAVTIRRLDREKTPVETAVDFDGEVDSKETIDFSDELGGDHYRVDLTIEGGAEETRYLFDYSYGEATIVGPDEISYEFVEV